MKSFLGQARILGALAMSAGVLGLVRELLIARRFGATAGTDAYYVAFAIPSLLYAFTVGSGLSFAVIPRLAPKLDSERRAGNKAFAELLSLLAVLGIAGALFILFFSAALLRIFAPGLAHSALAVRFTALLSPVFFLYVAAYSLAVFQCATHRAGWWGWSALLLNAGIVTAILALGSRIGVSSLVVGTLAGAFLALVVQVWLARRAGFSEPFRNPFRGGEGARMALAMLPFALALGIGGESGTSQADVFLARYFASKLAPGSVTLVALGNKLIGFPIVLVGFTLGIAVLPGASTAFSEGHRQDAARNALLALSYALLLICPVFILFLDEHLTIARLLFGGGALGRAQIAELGRILENFAGALVALTLSSVLGRLLAASRKTSLLIAAGILTVALDAALMVWLSPRMGASGIALAISVSSSVYCLALGLPVLRRLGRALCDELARRLVLIGAGGLVMHLVLTGAMRLGALLPRFDAGRGAVPVVAALAAYAVCLLPSECRWRVGYAVK